MELRWYFRETGVRVAQHPFGVEDIIEFSREIRHYIEVVVSITTFHTMNKTDWDKYQVNNPNFGTKLVSELTEKQAKNELCFCIETLERILDFNEKLSKDLSNGQKN